MKQEALKHEVTTQDFLSIHQSLLAIAGMKFSAHTSYRISKSVKKSNSLMKEYQRKQMVLLQEFGTLSDDKSHYTFADGQSEPYQAEIKKLNEEMTELDFPKVSIHSLDGYQIEPVHLAMLDGILFVDLPEEEITKAAND